MHSVPWTYTPRPDTRTTNVRLGIWLFLASEAMFFGSLFSAYVLLRTGAATWVRPDEWSSVTTLAVMTTLLVIASAAARASLTLSVLAGTVFLLIKGQELWRLLHGDWHPAVNLTAACWFVLTLVHWLHVAGGVAAGVWVARAARHLPALHLAERRHALVLYWLFIDLVWLAILLTFFI